jgi:hypothetical protein
MWRNGKGKGKKAGDTPAREDPQSSPWFLNKLTCSSNILFDCKYVTYPFGRPLYGNSRKHIPWIMKGSNYASINVTCFKWFFFFLIGWHGKLLTTRHINRCKMNVKSNITHNDYIYQQYTTLKTHLLSLEVPFLSLCFWFVLRTTYRPRGPCPLGFHIFLSFFFFFY